MKEAASLTRIGKDAMKLVRPFCVLLLLALSSGTASVHAQELAAGGSTPGQEVVQKRRYRLEMYRGKGYVFCEALLNEAKRLHPKGEYLPLEPILSWKAIFGIRGGVEPTRAELDPLQHEALFLKLHALHELYAHPKPHERSNSVDRFFAGDRLAAACPPGKPCVVPPLTPEERQEITLTAYRTFGRNGGHMRAYATDIGEAGFPRPAQVVQHEYPAPPPWSFSYSGWFGFTFYAKPDLSDVAGADTKNTVEAGLYNRLILYREKPYLLQIEPASTLSVRYVLSPYWECRIDQRQVDARP